MSIDLNTKLIDKLLHSLTPQSESIDTLWKQEIDKRVNTIKSGQISLVDINDVFCKIQELRLMQFRFHPNAELELNQAIDYYEKCQEHLGLEFPQ